MLVAIIDIDGTLANNDHRAHHVTRDEGDARPKDWAAFLQPHLVEKDVAVAGARQGLAKLAAMGAHLIFLTGRNESLRDVTSQWLTEHMGVTPALEDLIMRPTGNMMKPTEYKGAALQQVRAQYRVATLLCIDDDSYMWEHYAAINGIVLKAPECWDVLFPVHVAPEPEGFWRR